MCPVVYTYKQPSDADLHKMADMGTLFNSYTSHIQHKHKTIKQKIPLLSSLTHRQP